MNLPSQGPLAVLAIVYVIFQAQKRIMRRRRAMVVAAAVACVATTADWLRSRSRKSYWRRLRAAHSREARRCRQVQYIRGSLQLEEMDEATYRFWFR
jgi:metal-dependent HD superfamily phosphatase/phosphodiesterase